MHLFQYALEKYAKKRTAQVVIINTLSYESQRQNTKSMTVNVFTEKCQCYVKISTGSIDFQRKNGFPTQKLNRRHIHTKTYHKNPNNIQKQLFSTSPNWKTFLIIETLNC